MDSCEIAVVGAGPFGLSAAAHLKDKGLDVRVFGEVMSFWDRQMPQGMLLRSPWVASHLSDPRGKLTLEAYRHAANESFSAPVPREQFVKYGKWFQRQVVRDLDTRTVSRINLNGSFNLRLEDGELITAKRVVVAAGIGSFVSIPPVFSELPSDIVSHSSEHRDFSRFKGKKVVVIGGGQSSLESAALLCENGADVEIVVRAPSVIWLRRVRWLHSCQPLEQLLFAPPDVGPAGVSQLVARPNLFRRLPRKMQNQLAVRSIRPAGAAWLRPRLNGVTITTGRKIVSATRSGNCVHLRLDDRASRTVDHAILATGYKVNICRYGFLAPELLASIDQVQGYPRLNLGFESSVSGLHFLGAPASWSFGPLMRFVAGTKFAAIGLSKGILETGNHK